jgi:hypothetical protein
MQDGRKKVMTNYETAVPLPLFPTMEGGEGRGEEVLIKIPLSPALSPLVPRGERESQASAGFAGA